jgi:ankyrin repeat protein
MRWFSQDELGSSEKRRRITKSTGLNDVSKRPALPKRLLDGLNETELEVVSQGSRPASKRAIANAQANQLLLDNGFDIEADSFNMDTTLRWAAENGHEVVVRLLLQHGADANAEDIHEMTALQWAVMNGHEAVVRLLLRKKASTKADKTYRMTLLHMAAIQGHETIVRLLLMEGIDISAEDT